MKAHRLSVVVGLALFAIAIWILIHEVGTLGPGRVAAAFRQERRGALSLALALVALNYAVLTLHDQLAVAYVGRKLSRWRVSVASFVGFAVSNTMGFGVLSGATVRYRFYRRWDLNAAELSRIVAFYSGSIWLGLLVLGGLSLAVDPAPAMTTFVPAPTSRAAGVLLIAIAVAYVVACRIRRTPLRIGRFELPLPSPGMALAQIGVSTADWMLAASILFSLLPSPRPSYFSVAGAFAAAQLMGLVSHVPGSVGVFEGLMILFLKPAVDSAQLLQTLLLFRVLYYLVPLVVALVALAVHEARKVGHT